MSQKKPDIPIESRPLLSLSEASAYFGINTNKLTKMLSEPHCPFVLKNGNKYMVKKDVLIEYLMNKNQI